MQQQDLIASLEAMLARGDDNATLRFALASRYLAAGRAEDAMGQAQAAVDLDGGYSAAWKLLGRAQAEAGKIAEAIATYERGIAVAQARGDQQVGNEMRVFLKRLQAEQRPAAPDPSSTNDGSDGNGR
jgi:tetratricopeptide (TPR) repeat protein